LLREHPGLAGFISWPRAQWRDLYRRRQFGALFQAIAAFRRELRNHRFDMALDLQGLLKSGFLAWLSGAKRRIGLGSKEGSQIFMHATYSRQGLDESRIGSEYLYLATQLGLDVGNFDLAVFPGEAERQWFERHRGDLFDKDLLVICPFTTRPQKHWPESHWRKLLHQLPLDGKIVMLGGKADIEAAQHMGKGLNIVNLVGQTTLLQAVQVIQSARCVVGVDTGLTHVGHGFKKPVICLFGSTCPYTDANNPNARILYLAKACSPCHRRPTCEGRFDCLVDLTPDFVAKQLMNLWNQHDHN
jgi:heptosyltransferase-1